MRCIKAPIAIEGKLKALRRIGNSALVIQYLVLSLLPFAIYITNGIHIPGYFNHEDLVKF